ncbi:hypothetical protein IWW34DRAFT_641297 [Fusarium oxysporum f. sp. albedinis]|nr:hypothetical protein IWW34DRAFT_641297 [Fusarium oxysporum f. sp. albedinis]
MSKPTELKPQGQVASPTEDMIEEGDSQLYSHPDEPRREEWRTSIIGTITGRLTDTGHFRKVFFAGLLATVVGIFASSFCHRFKEYLVTLGIAVGVGNGCLFCAMLTVMSSYFDKKRAIAIGVAACGSVSGVPTFIYVRGCPKKTTSKLIDWSAFRNTSYNHYAAASFFLVLEIFP